MLIDRIEDARILIVDDQEANVRFLERVLRQAGYRNLRWVQDARRVRSVFDAYAPDLVLLDLLMPYFDGYQVMTQLRQSQIYSGYLPILVITADSTIEAKQRALSSGATDFLTKPVHVDEVILRVRNLLQTRSLYLQIHRQNEALEEKVRQRTSELREAQLETLNHLALAAEYRDDETHEHTVRVGLAAARLAGALGLAESVVALIGQAAPLHDLGKLGIPDQILLKPGTLTIEEFELIKTHVRIGARILSGSRSLLLQLGEEIALTHHERWDGSGYLGLRGDEIPLPGRIVAVVDVFDALTHERPYKRAWPVDQALAEIAIQSGRHFDPEIAEAFLRLWREGELLQAGYSGEDFPAIDISA